MKKTTIVGLGVVLGVALVATVALAWGPGFGQGFGRGFGDRVRHPAHPEPHSRAIRSDQGIEGSFS